MTVKPYRVATKAETPEFGPVILQVSEEDQQVFEDPYITEQLCELGFYSKAFATPVTAWRIRTPEKGSPAGLVDFVAYG